MKIKTWSDQAFKSEKTRKKQKKKNSYLVKMTPSMVGGYYWKWHLFQPNKEPLHQSNMEFLYCICQPRSPTHDITIDTVDWISAYSCTAIYTNNRISYSHLLQTLMSVYSRAFALASTTGKSYSPKNFSANGPIYRESESRCTNAFPRASFYVPWYFIHPFCPNLVPTRLQRLRWPRSSSRTNRRVGFLR